MPKEPMTLVERLRNPNWVSSHLGPFADADLDTKSTRQVMIEAADEIERLRAALERIRNVLHAHNRPDKPLANAKRIACRDIADLALEKLSP